MAPDISQDGDRIVSCSQHHAAAAPDAAASCSTGQPPCWQPGEQFTVILWYRYACLSNNQVQLLVSSVRERCTALGLAGRVLLAVEGVNGTLAGSEAAIQAFTQFFEACHPAFTGIDWKRSSGAGQHLPFPDLSVKQLNEIINTGAAKQKLDQFISFDPTTFGGLADETTGVHLTPHQFHQMLQAHTSPSAAPPSSSSPVQSPRTSSQGPASPSSSSSTSLAPLIIDVRNLYEYQAGHFQGAVPLEVATYAESWKLLDRLIEEHELRTTPKPVLMYCTGGIRCEKASAYLRASGVGADRVFQLQGGIHRYMEEFRDGGLFMGKNVVFDARCSMAPEPSAHDTRTGQEALQDGPGTAAALTCLHCPAAHGLLPGRCAVCNAVVLVCPPCSTQHCGMGEFHCKRHTHLEHLYFKDLAKFDGQQLQQQLEGLKALLAAAEGTALKQRRRTLRNQIVRVEQQQQLLATSEAC